MICCEACLMTPASSESIFSTLLPNGLPASEKCGAEDEGVGVDHGLDDDSSIGRERSFSNGHRTLQAIAGSHR
jgi:hypothetical protein